MTDYMYAVPSDTGILRITITPEVVNGESEARIERTKDLAG